MNYRDTSMTYECTKCGDEWEFCEEDYGFVMEDYPDICPLCVMPISQMFREVFREEGFWESINRIFKRLFIWTN